MIPVPISKAVWSCMGVFLVQNGAAALIQACDKIQPNILCMILKSEGDRLKHLQGPPAREKKYAIMAYS